MKKKIKDLTRDEIEEICKKFTCHDCPLYVPCDTSCKNSYPSKYGEEEVLCDVR